VQVVKLEIILRYIRPFNWSTNSSMVMSDPVPFCSTYVSTYPCHSICHGFYFGYQSIVTIQLVRLFYFQFSTDWLTSLFRCPTHEKIILYWDQSEFSYCILT